MQLYRPRNDAPLILAESLADAESVAAEIVAMQDAGITMPIGDDDE